MGEGLKRAFAAAKRTRLPGGLTPAEVVALGHVESGSVYQVFTASGNTFEGPRGTASQTWRRLRDRRLIEDAPRQSSRSLALNPRVLQQLTQAGRDALAAQSEQRK